jgi:hypothetical protein
VCRELLTPNFNTYKLASEPIFERSLQVDIPGGGTRATNRCGAPAGRCPTLPLLLRCWMEKPSTLCASRQLGGGIDFASTAMRVNFNDLQPDRVYPHERFYTVSNDGHLLLLSLADDHGDEHAPAFSESPLAVEKLHHIQPPLQNGEIVSVCGCGEIVVICRHSGSLTLLRRTPAPVCCTSVVGQLRLLERGSLASTQDGSDPILEHGENQDGACKKTKADHSSTNVDHGSALDADHDENGWTSAYYLLDARVGSCSREGATMQVTVLVAVVSRPRAGSQEPFGGQTRSRLQRLHLERKLASEGWKTVSTAGVAVGTAIPALARLWPTRDEMLIGSSRMYHEEEAAHETGPLDTETEIADQAAEYEQGEAGQNMLVHFHLPVESDDQGMRGAEDGDVARWKVETYVLHDKASGPLTWIGLGGGEPCAYSLPALGLGAKSGLGMHDLHVMRVTAVPAGAAHGCSGPGSAARRGHAYTLTAEHALTFPAVGYIQKGKSNKKGVTFSSNTAIPAAVIADAEEGLHVYESNARGVLASGAADRTAGGEGAAGGASRATLPIPPRYEYAGSKFTTKARQTSIDPSGGGCGDAAEAGLGGSLLGYRVVGR